MGVVGKKRPSMSGGGFVSVAEKRFGYFGIIAQGGPICVDRFFHHLTADSLSVAPSHGFYLFSRGDSLPLLDLDRYKTAIACLGFPIIEDNLYCFQPSRAFCERDEKPKETKRN